MSVEKTVGQLVEMLVELLVEKLVELLVGQLGIVWDCLKVAVYLAALFLDTRVEMLASQLMALRLENQ